MAEILPWIYMINAVFLINHEIDSAYWKEWDLFKIKGGISTFLVLHFPLLFLVLLGNVLLFQHKFIGSIFSLVLSFAGIFAYGIHVFFIKKGNPQFNTTISLFILRSTLPLSIVQAGVTIYLLLF
jgi:hypothetical protein